MFTGAIKHTGTIQSIDFSDTVSITFEINSDMYTLSEQDHVSVDGIATYIEKSFLSFYTVHLHPDIYYSSAFQHKKRGDCVHIEPALRLGEQIEGLMVSGTLDGIGTVTKTRRIGEKMILSIRPEEGLMKYMSVRGSVVVNGLELSILARETDCFVCPVYRHLLQISYFDTLQEGDSVNLEISSVARYLENLMERSHFFRPPQQV